MHADSMNEMRRFAASLPTLTDLSVLDVGSLDVNGTYRDLFRAVGATYTGLDIAAGPNVDVVVEDPWCWRELHGQQFDVVISGQCIEHVTRPWETMRLIAEHVKPGGWVCVIAPFTAPEHAYPLDCYRFLPDGMRALAEYAGLQVERAGFATGGADTVLVARRADVDQDTIKE